MRIMLFGVGRQGRVALHALNANPDIMQIIAVDRDHAQAESFIRNNGCRKASSVYCDLKNKADINHLLTTYDVQAVVCLLPLHLNNIVIESCIAHKKPVLLANKRSTVARFDEAAQQAGVAILPELGIDPGLDHILGRWALSELDDVWGIYFYTGGIPAREDDSHPLHFKISWDFNRVLQNTQREGTVIRLGSEKNVPATEIFKNQHCHMLDVEGAGKMEAFVNGNTVEHIANYGLKDIKDAGCFALRWPGFCERWDLLARLGLFSDKPVEIEKDMLVAPSNLIGKLLTPQMLYKDNEKDFAIVRVDAWGKKDGKRCRVVTHMADKGDRKTGFMAVNRAIGFTVAEAAALYIKGKIKGSGVLHPYVHIPYIDMIENLKTRGLKVTKDIYYEQAGKPGKPLI